MPKISYTIPMKDKRTVGILFGGKSAEHEVSIRSARYIAASLNPVKYEVVYIKIEKDGTWIFSSSSKLLETSNDPDAKPMNLDQGFKERYTIDVMFPVLHGPNGEDGTVQGFFKVFGVPFVGAGVLGSAVGMDKDVMKRLLRDAGISIGEFVSCTSTAVPAYQDVIQMLSPVVFVKPANLGSSVGISRVTTEDEYKKAVNLAFEFDTKVIIEEGIEGRELECAVLGGEPPQASIPSEIILGDSFYSYDEKYAEESKTTFEIPPRNLEDAKIKEIQALAVKVFTTLSCEGLGRVDFFLKQDGALLVNEINTLPGFTEISMYPKMWEKSGLPGPELVDRLIMLALERHAKESALKTSYQ